VNDRAWIRSLPSSWKAKPLRAAADYVVSNVDKVPADDEVPVRLCNYTDVYNNEFITLGLDFMQATATESEIAKFGLAVGDVIITKDSESWDDIAVPAVVRESASDLVCGYHLALLRPRKQEIDGDFLFRCLQAKPVRFQLELAANGVTRFGIPKADIGAARLPVPPLPVQRAIADYLDRETARMDGLIAAKERVLDLLAEKRRALITRAVTRGLDPHAPLRESGIPWLGEIPEPWETRKVAWLFRERDERCEPELPLLEVSINLGVVLREFSDERIESTAADFNTYKVARRGDVVFNKMRMWQGAVGVAPEDGLVSPDYVVAAPKGPLASAYAHLLFRTEAFSAECARHSHGIVWDRLRLYWEGFRDIEVPLPPSREQDRIVEHTARETAKLENVRVATERTSALLKERRSALIAAAVTGQIDVESAT
jgi:type I restriction enzyme, S subunit